MDKKMLADTFAQFLKQVKKAQNSKAPTDAVMKQHGFKPKTIKALKVGNVAIKMAETLVAMNAVDALAAKVHDLIPNTANGLEWLHALPSKIANQTIGRIPILGAIYRWINNAIAEGYARLSEFLGNDTLAAEARKRKRTDPDAGFNASYDDNRTEGEDEMKNNSKTSNSPKWYENLGLHRPFTIPGSYTKTTLLNGTLSMPTIVAHRVTENPVPELTALIDRLNQKYSLIKAVRGLSATTYDVVDLANYERFAKFALHLYYSVKIVIQAAKTYDLVQTQIGDNIIAAKGFVASEVRANLADYETLLCQLYRWIENNLPMTGTWIEKFKYIKCAMIPDYQDKKIATIHMFALSMTDVFPVRDAIRTNVLTFDEIPNSGSNSYAVIMGHFTNMCTYLVANKRWQELIADYFGAFGSKAMWSDSSYPEYKDPLNLGCSNDDLAREQVKNALPINAKVAIMTITEGKANYKVTVDTDDISSKQYPHLVPGYNIDFSDEAALNYESLLNSTSYKVAEHPLTSASGDNNCFFLWPDCNGVGAQTVKLDASSDNAAEDTNLQNPSVMFTLHKDNYTEGESLEIAQFKVLNVRRLTYLSKGGAFRLFSTFETNEYAIIDSHVYTYASIGGSFAVTKYVLCNEAITDDDLQDSESAVDYPDEMSCWSLIDWMPGLHFTFFGYNSDDSTYVPRDCLLLDIDGYGSLDVKAFTTSISYTVFSLQGAGLTVSSKGKRVNNLGDVYKDKANTKA